MLFALLQHYKGSVPILRVYRKKVLFISDFRPFAGTGVPETRELAVLHPICSLEFGGPVALLEA